LPVEGSPLAYVTELVHDPVLRIKGKAGAVDLPIAPNPARGGYVVDTRKLRPDSLDAATSGTLHAYWGFQPFDGPSFQLRNSHPTNWTVAPSDQTALIVGREDTLRLQSEDASCVQSVTMKDRDGSEVSIDWKIPKPGRLAVQLPLPLKDSSAGPITVLVRQYGMAQADAVHLQAYSEAGRLDEFEIHEGDREGKLKGTRLDEVATLELGGANFSPAGLSRVKDRDQLRLSAGDSKALTRRAGDKITAHITLKDGRSLKLPTVVGQPRPQVALIGKTIDSGPSGEAIRLGGEGQLPQDGKLSFILKAEVPAIFPRDQQIEVDTEDGSFKLWFLKTPKTSLRNSIRAVLAVQLSGRCDSAPFREN
jgi:hypothetical protein